MKGNGTCGLLRGCCDGFFRSGMVSFGSGKGDGDGRLSGCLYGAEFSGGLLSDPGGEPAVGASAGGGARGGGCGAGRRLCGGVSGAGICLSGRRTLAGGESGAHGLYRLRRGSQRLAAVDALCAAEHGAGGNCHERCFRRGRTGAVRRDAGADRSDGTAGAGETVRDRGGYIRRADGEAPGVGGHGQQPLRSHHRRRRDGAVSRDRTSAGASS